MPLDLLEIVLGIIIGIVSFFAGAKYNKWSEIKTAHRKEIIDFIKRSLINISFIYDIYHIRKDLNSTQGDRLLVPTIAHLKSYKTLKQDWQKMNSLVSDINQDLAKLQTFMRLCIISILGESEFHGIDTKFSHLILRNVIENHLTFDSMAIEKDGKNHDVVFYLTDDKKSTTSIKRMTDLDHYYPKIIDLFNNQELRDLVNQIYQKKKELDQTRKSFINLLNDLLYKTEQGYEISGKCEDCPKFLQTKVE